MFIGEPVTCKFPAGPGRETKQFTECNSRSIKETQNSDISWKHTTQSLGLATKHRAKSSPGQKDLDFVVNKDVDKLGVILN